MFARLCQTVLSGYTTYAIGHVDPSGLFHSVCDGRRFILLATVLFLDRLGKGAGLDSPEMRKDRGEKGAMR